jgi:type I restriction enzyme M protein
MEPTTETYLTLEKKVLQAFDIVRGEVDARQYYLICFFLILRKENVIEHLDYSKMFIDEHLKEVLKGYEGAYRDVLVELLDEYHEIFITLSDNALVKLNKWFLSLDVRELEVHFSNLIEAILYKIAKAGGRSSGEFLSPIELSRFLSKIFNTEYSLIFNPFAGLASFGVFLDESCVYVGQEINHLIKTIGELRLLAYGKKGNSFLFQGDSFKSWDFLKEKYDLIISSPPFGMRPEAVSRSSAEKRWTAEHHLINKGIDYLKPEGKLIAVVSNSFLSGLGPEHPLRERLVDQDLLEMVISFPAGMLSNTNIPISVIVINKNKKQQGHVRCSQLH